MSNQPNGPVLALLAHIVASARPEAPPAAVEVGTHIAVTLVLSDLNAVENGPSLTETNFLLLPAQAREIAHDLLQAASGMSGD